MVSPLTRTLRDSVLGYVYSHNDDDALLYFNKLVSICTANTVKMFLPVRTVGYGESKHKVIKDNPIRDLAELFVCEQIARWLLTYPDMTAACETGRFDYLGRAFRQSVLNEIRRIERSKEEIWVEPLPDENKYTDEE